LGWIIKKKMCVRGFIPEPNIEKAGVIQLLATGQCTCRALKNHISRYWGIRASEW
jgi:hypothetical protein